MPLVLAGATSGSATVQATDAQTVTLTLPATTGTLAVSGGSPSFATLTVTGDASISGLTVGKGGGASEQNTAIGRSALAGSNTGLYNTAIGRDAMAINTSGARNTAVGAYTQNNQTTGTSNSSLGVGALNTNSTGSYNCAIGDGSLINNTTASNNTAVGYQSLYTNSTGAGNVGLGYKALYANTTASYNTAIGFNAGSTNTTGSITAVGTNALLANTTGTSNTAVGGYDYNGQAAALQSNTTGSYNIAVGTSALQANTTASNNTAVGYQAGYTGTSGGGNTFMGYQAGYSFSGTASDNYNNVAIGRNAGYALTSGYGHTFVGANSGNLVTTGLFNTILGSYTGNQGGLDIRTSSNYIVLSDGQGNPRGIFDGSGNLYLNKVTNADNFVGNYLAANGAVSFTMAASTNAASTLNIYSTGASAYRFYVTMDGKIYCTSTTIAGISDQRLKENVRDLDVGLDAIMAVKPRRFDWKEGKGQDKKDAVGFIAQEFETVFPDSINTSKAGEDGIEYKTVCHEELIPAMVKAIQELKATVDAQAARIAVLEGSR
jgi:hypothetical protein